MSAAVGRATAPAVEEGVIDAPDAVARPVLPVVKDAGGFVWGLENGLENRLPPAVSVVPLPLVAGAGVEGVTFEVGSGFPKRLPPGVVPIDPNILGVVGGAAAVFPKRLDVPAAGVVAESVAGVVDGAVAGVVDGAGVVNGFAAGA